MDKVDSLGMCKVYDKWPEIAESSFNMDSEPIEYDKIDHILFAGMGGSWSLSDIFSPILSIWVKNNFSRFYGISTTTKRLLILKK